MAQDSISQVLQPGMSPQVEFRVTDRLEQARALVSVTFLAEQDYRRLPPDASITLNGVPMPAKPLAKGGVWYQVDVPRASAYELYYSRSASGPSVRVAVLPFEFAPSVPPTISRKKGMTLATGALPPGIDVFALFSAAEGDPEMRGATVRGIVQGNAIHFSPEALANVRPGNTDLQIGVRRKERSHVPGHTLLYVPSVTRAVKVD